MAGGPEGGGPFPYQRNSRNPSGRSARRKSLGATPDSGPHSPRQGPHRHVLPRKDSQQGPPRATSRPKTRRRAHTQAGEHREPAPRAYRQLPPSWRPPSYSRESLFKGRFKRKGISSQTICLSSRRCRLHSPTICRDPALRSSVAPEDERSLRATLGQASGM